jgi:hypothetical protein
MLMLGGKIWLESEVGKVQYFYFTLPFSSTRRKIIIENVLMTKKIVMGENLKNIICRSDR